MRKLWIVLLMFGATACASDAVPVNIDLPDEQVAALSADRSASLEIQLDDSLVSLWRASPSKYDCHLTPILMRNTDATGRFIPILEKGDAPIGFARLIQEYPEIARFMRCTDGPDTLMDDLDILELESLSPGQYTLVYSWHSPFRQEQLHFYNLSNKCQVRTTQRLSIQQGPGADRKRLHYSPQAMRLAIWLITSPR